MPPPLFLGGVRASVGSRKQPGFISTRTLRWSWEASHPSNIPNVPRDPEFYEMDCLRTGSAEGREEAVQTRIPICS